MFFGKRKLTPPVDAQRDVHAWQQQLASQACDRLNFIRSHIHANPPEQLPTLVADGFAYVAHLTDVLMRAQPGGRQSLPQPVSKVRFVVSSLFLKRAWRYLTTDPEQRERMALITGPMTTDETRVLSDMHHVETSSQSAAYVQADPRATAAQIDQLTDTDGHRLHAMWHSHIMKGQVSTRPSQVDLDHQARLVTIGMTETLGGIFTLDGYVRVFSTAIDFDLTLYGAHVEMISDEPRTKIFKLDIAEADDAA